MPEPSAAPDHQAEPATRSTRDSVTRGFLFTDLRGYTSYVERHGAAAAALLLGRYRQLVRQEIAAFDGAEIRTEGDSFYVVFGSVSSAVRCGIAIAQVASEAPGAEPVDIGIGIHAGETVETTAGYVGTAVNIAARLCALAGPREVLVSDTVRALTQTLLPVRFVPRGRRRLKGITEPVAVFAVVPADGAAGAWGAVPVRWWRRRGALVAAAAALVVVAVGAVAWMAARPATLPPGPWKIGVSIPLTGSQAPDWVPIANAIRLAVDEANESGVGGAGLELDVRDDGANDEFGISEQRAAMNATAFVGDPRVLAMIGSMHSPQAVGQIPITNEAGLLQCGPSTTEPELTKPEAGALDVRSTYPERVNYVRLAAPADVEATAAAFYAYNVLGARTALVIDDTDVGGLVADAFEDEFAALGGEVVRRSLNPDGDPTVLLEPLAGAGEGWLVYFGGFTGAADVRRAMVDAGHADVPYFTWDALFDGSGAQDDSYLATAGDVAAGSYVTHPTVGTISAAFEERYRAAYGESPRGNFADYVGAAYVCGEIIVTALRGVAEARPSADELREALRAYVVDPERRFETALGRIGFDANGDSTQQIVTLYRVDPSAAGGAGDWVVVQQRDFAEEE
jgi:branched-chain amino acid transport system substrate-binding protein